MTSAVIVGCDGQDGILLRDSLTASGYQVCGISRSTVRGGLLGLPGAIDILDASQVACLLKCLRPAEIYYLAAFHHSSEDVPISDAALYAKSHEAHVQGLLNFLEGMRQHSPTSRLFYAASALVFGFPGQAPQDEQTPIRPECIYGITKAAGLHLVRHYRNHHGLFSAGGILYNHESSLRSPRFVTQKIVSAAIDIKHGTTSHLRLGDLSAATDWGYAPDFVAAMHRILCAEAADDFVIATGVRHTVQEFVEITFGYLGLDWQRHVSEDRAILSRRRGNLIGDSGKLTRVTGWQPSVDLRGMIHHLLTSKGAFDA